MAPAVGGPARLAKEHRASIMPKRMPILLGSSVRLARAAKNVPWLALEAMLKAAL